jgi:thymidylate synthase
MIVLSVRNVRHAYYQGIRMLLSKGRQESSRAGDVLVMRCPVTTVYAYPRERVLLDARRDANPFFHMAEALWMLAGREDAALLNRYVRDFGERFAEQDGTIHDAYGRRWRNHFGYDQLSCVVDMLSWDPTTRQAVLQMWDCWYDGADDLQATRRTRPCNTHVYLRIRRETGYDDANNKVGGMYDAVVTSFLDLTVCCRSNDMIFGGYGANAVHFSILQEYVAGMLGIAVGKLYQVSNNFHAYVDVLQRVREPRSPPDYEGTSLPLVADPQTFDEELRAGVRWMDGEWGDSPHIPGVYRNPFLSEVAAPLLHAHALYRRHGPRAGLDAMSACGASDWRQAGEEWFARRMKKQNAVE